MKKTQFGRILFLTSFWLLAAVFLVSYDRALVVYDIRTIYGVTLPSGDFGGILATTSLVALAGSLFVASFEVLYLSRRLRRMPLGTTLVIKTGFYLINIFLFTSAAMLFAISEIHDRPVLHPSVLASFAQYLVTPRMLMLLLYWALVVALGLFLLEVSDKFGHGVLINFLSGKYHSPREENRIFMFLDLTSSTTYAERLGHFRYSRLLQECFYDLTDVAIRNHAQIYQYVGDEVVLTWEQSAGLKDGRCVAAFLEFEEVLKTRRGQYLDRYGVEPEFKAGLNTGKVAVAEVGEIKKEIAYHGDALNTAARVRSLCGATRQRLLITGTLLALLPDLSSMVDIVPMGQSRLRGRNRSVDLFSIRRKIPAPRRSFEPAGQTQNREAVRQD